MGGLRYIDCVLWQHFRLLALRTCCFCFRWVSPCRVHNGCPCLWFPFSPPFPHTDCTRQAPTLLEMLLRCWVQGKLGAGATPDAGELVSLPRTLIPVVIDKFGAAYTGKSAKWAFATALHAFMTTSWSEATGGCLFFAFPGVVRITGPG
jgi:hypothetical protein